MLAEICNTILKHYEALEEDLYDSVREKYMQKLYRNKGFHTFVLPSGIEIEAKIIDIHPLGPILLEDSAGHQEFYAFKEIHYKL